jgi:hypothetical protein
MMFVVFALILAPCYGYNAFRHRCLTRMSISDDFDASDFNKVLKESTGAVWNSNGADNEILNKIRDEQIAREENIYRKYPFEETKLPVLTDCNNYFSGKFGEYFWHQNSDQVYVYIPIDSSLTKKDIDVEFKAGSVAVNIKDALEIKFDCLEKIIPDGSFWIFEKDVDDKLYLQLDLEKRFRMINWKSLFGEPVKNPALDEMNRKDMLEKLFAANKGMSRLTGKPAETMEEMMSNEDMVKMMGKKYFLDPEILGAEDGEEITEEDIIDVEAIESATLDIGDDSSDNSN